MRKKLLGDAAADDLTIMRFTRTVRKSIKLLSGALAAIFVWIQFSNFPLVDIVSSSITPILLWHGGLALYFTSWVAGSSFDVDVQEQVYASFPRRGSVPAHGFVMILLIAVGGTILFWTERHIQRFAIAISIFFVIDQLSWRYLIWLLNTNLKVVPTSEKTYKDAGRYFALEALKVVSYQIQGKWRWWRIAASVPFVILIDVFAFSNTVQSYLTNVTLSLIPHMYADDAKSVISGTLVFSIIVVTEMWQWVMRMKTLVSLDFIDEMSGKYSLIPKEEQPEA